MAKARIVLIALFLLFFLPAMSVMAQEGENAKQKNSPPFLITGKMPHLTKLLVQQWDSEELHLLDTQKNRLLVVRKETIGAVKKLGKEIMPLEKLVADGILAGKTPAELQSLVQTIAGLKAEATMVHLRCIHNTSSILDRRQLELLNNL